MSVYDYDDLVRPTTSALEGAWAGVFAEDVADFNVRANVIIKAFAQQLKLGPYRWQSRDATTLPNKGDACLIVFDDTGEGWIAAWWPAT